MSDDSRKDAFQFWLMDMDDAIDRFVQSAPADVRSSLDLTGASLDAIEALVLARYKTPADTRSAQEAAFLDGAARYVGEVLRVATGSKWSIRFDDPKFVFHGLPILTGGTLTVPCCPLTTVTASTDRRTGRYFSLLLGNATRQ